MKLTVERLKLMKAGQIFLAGTILDQRIYIKYIRWVAVRGLGFHDWAIYYLVEDYDFVDIAKHGDKIFAKEVIKDLVDCDDDAFNLYRY